ncbi:hypothetical protein IF2G_02179 [Cordyceps javanica]|nr:hypothetical protein IF2G_02179 [Cordyceps javanica]
MAPQPAMRLLRPGKKRATRSLRRRGGSHAPHDYTLAKFRAKDLTSQRIYHTFLCYWTLVLMLF